MRITTSFKSMLQKVQKAFEARLENIPDFTKVLGDLPRLTPYLIFLLGFHVADILVQASLGFYFISSKIPAPLPPKVIKEKTYLPSKMVYEPILRKNAFCPGCPIPDVRVRRQAKVRNCDKAKSQSGSGIQVLGTIVLSQPQHSVAIVRESSTSESKAFKIGDHLSVGEIFDIRRNKICLENPNGKLVFIEIPPEPTIRFGQPLPQVGKMDIDEGIERKSDTEVEIKRSFLLEKLEDPDLLFQAKAIPIKNPDGSIRCFKLSMIVPGSVYEKIGLQVDDCLSSVNGDALNSISKAQKLYAAARTAEEVNLEVERGGAPLNLKFKVRQ